jgi:hypothetical protein
VVFPSRLGEYLFEGDFMKFEYKTHILCIEDYISPNKNNKFQKGETYYVGLRNHPLFGLCYYELQEDGESVTGYFIEKDKRLFKEIKNATQFILK